MRSKIYLKANGVEYYGYDFYCEGLEREDLVYIDENIINDIIDNCTTNGFIPQKGMKAYVVPGCPRAIADIRKDYVIKRRPEDADFIVSSLRKDKYLHYYRFDTIMIIPSKKAVVCYDRYGYGSRRPLQEYAELIFPDYIVSLDPTVFVIQNNGNDWFYAYRAENIGLCIDKAMGVQGKPVIDYSQLPTYTSNQLCFDTLEMIYKIGTSDRTKNNGDNLTVQLQALNQTNWRDYPGTIHLLYKLMTKGSYNCANEKFARMSAFPKAIKELCQTMCRGGEYISQDDLDMGRKLLEKITGFDFQENKFWDMKQIYETLSAHQVSRSCFYELYDNIVKIRPKCLN